MPDLSRRSLLMTSTSLVITAGLAVPEIRHPGIIGLSPIEHARRSLGLDRHVRFGLMTRAEVRALEDLPPL